MKQKIKEMKHIDFKVQMTCNVNAILCIFDSQLGNRVFLASYSNRHISLSGVPNYLKFSTHIFTLS